MPSIHIPRGWKLPESEATPESAYLNRRQLFKRVASLTIGATVLSKTHRVNADHQHSNDPLVTGKQDNPPAADRYPARRNDAFALDRPVTPEIVAATFNNFYEFSSVNKTNIGQLAEHFPTHPWTVEIGGLVKTPKTYDIDDLVRKMQLEERLYRLRCVEAWAMAVPWTGFRMKSLIDMVEPQSPAKFVKMTSFMDPERAPGQKPVFGIFPTGPWPYTEGLTMEEAMNDLTLLVTGIYGHPLPKQHGAPIRLITPWKYGFKSIKSIVKIDFVAEQPATFWNTAVPHEYDFWANVNPNVPHQRWSQENEWMIPNRSERRPTLLYNGYEKWVADMYKT